MINVGVITGRLTAVPELKKTANGISVCHFTVAVQRDYTDSGGKRQADFIDCVAYRQSADFLCKHFGKGQMIAVEGKIHTRAYKDSNGTNHKVTELNAEQISFCGNKGIGAPKSSDAPENEDYTDIPEDDYGFPWADEGV